MSVPFRELLLATGSEGSFLTGLLGEGARLLSTDGSEGSFVAGLFWFDFGVGEASRLSLDLDSKSTCLRGEQDRARVKPPLRVTIFFETF